MTVKYTLRKIAVATAGSLLAAVTLGGGAQAVTDTIFKYTAPKTGYLSLHSGAFSNENLENGGTNYRNFEALAIAQTATGEACGSAAVNLPQGAVITSITMWGTGGDGDAPYFEYSRVNISTNVVQLIAVKALPEDATHARKAATLPVSASLGVIDNFHFWYLARACVHVSGVFHGARIAYTYTNAGN